jgi:hypothetical protein
MAPSGCTVAAARCVTILPMYRTQPHDDELEVALSHFNSSFRHGYRLPPLKVAWLRGFDDFPEAWDEGLRTARANGLTDASCAMLARISLSHTPRYAIGYVDGKDKADVFLGHGEAASYRSNHVVLVNPIGGIDNWREVGQWVRAASNRSRRATLAGLASERRPDYEAVDPMLRSGTRARILPADEAFSATRAAEVSFIYDVSVETLRTWKRALRGDQAAGKPGRPRNR